MGRDSNFLCKTCKKNYYLGYGSYSTWLDTEVKTYLEFEKLESKDKGIFKNMNYYRCLKEHHGHDFLTYSTDYISNINGNLEYDYDSSIFIENYSEYKHVNLDPDND